MAGPTPTTASSMRSVWHDTGFVLAAIALIVLAGSATVVAIWRGGLPGIVPPPSASEMGESATEYREYEPPEGNKLL